MPTKPTPGSITQTADSQKDRINNISNVSSAINAMQKDVDQKISETNKRVERKDEVQAVQGLMSQSISRLNQTIGALTTGIAKITTDTARATAGAINQYGKAISEDISFNKKSVVAMALAKTSPIYGYFVSKFMETNVWKQALTKMKTSIMQTMGAILRPFKGSPASRSQAPTPTRPQGAYPGEALGKVRADHLGGGSEGFSSGDVSQLISIQQQQLNYMQKTFGYEEKYYRSWFSRMSPMRLVRAFRRTKGNYTAQLSSSKQPLTNIAHNIATLYTQLMWRFDNLLEIQKANAVANRDLAMHTLKIKYPPIPGIRMRQLTKPLIRKLVGLAVRQAPKIAIAGMLAAGAPWAAIAGVLGAAAIKPLIKRGQKMDAERAKIMGEKYDPTAGISGFLSKRRGVYADAPKGPGFIKGIGGAIRGKFRQFLPTGEQLEMRGMEPGAVGGGLRESRGGPGRGAIAFSASKKRELARMGYGIAIGFSQVFGGRLGLRRPLWVAPIPGKLQKKYYAWSRTQDRIQSRSLRQIRESNEDQLDLQRKSYKRAGKWRLMDWLGKGMSLIGGFFTGIIGKVSDMLSGVLKGVFTNPVVLAALGGMVLEYIVVDALFDKFWDWWKTRDKRQRKYGEEIGGMRDKWSATAKSVPGIRGYKAKARLEASKFSPHSNVGDAKLNEIRRGQLDFIDQNTSNYMEFPLDKISGWRAEWSKRYGDRMLGQDPYKYGQTREQKFLNYLNSVKKPEMLSEKQKSEAMGARDKAITKINPNAIKEEKEWQEIYGPLKVPNMSEESTGLFGARSHGWARESLPGKINQATLTSQDAEFIEKQAEATSTPVVKSVKDLQQTVKDETQKSTIGIQSTTINSSNQITSSVQDSTNVSGGGGGGRNFGPNDPWYNTAVLSGGP